MAKRPLPDISILRQLLDYDSRSGLIRWKTGRLAGLPAGHIDDRGYVRINVLQVRVRGHQVAWALHYGVWPSHDIDHRNLKKGDNRIGNLRKATRSQNLANKNGRRSGLKGVFFCKCTGRWRARLRSNCAVVELGRHDTEEDAARAYDAAAKIHFGEFARLNFPDGAST